ncbi:growth-regulating factor 2-like [Bidens hawaiensis]|uniref:growth-regulating factor 2-like n=1 Tax=Bidens hawaiensis TaxID=980011 RepID=UPI00404B5873
MATFDNTCVLSHDDIDNKTHTHGSGRSDDHQLFLQACKSSRTDYFDQPNKSMSLRSDSLLSPSAADSNNMLSFSSSSSDKYSNHTSLFSFCQPSHSYIKNTGYGYGGPVSRYKGPFTPSQWMELEHQALIYKHFVANVPVPSNLLNPIRKSLNSFLFPGSSSSTSYVPGSYGWGTFHYGFVASTDPEPGRCRRTDGKKWRCSRDAVPDQKYCERHINRGRHRSRKPVESQTGQAVTGPTNSKVGPSVPVSLPIASTPINRTQKPQVCSANYYSILDHGSSNPNPNLNPLSNFVEPLKPDWTQLSMSIPAVASDFSSSSNSPAREKLVGSGGLTNDFDPTQKHASNRIPISWGNSSSMGGPLGEMLNRSSGLEMSEMWAGSSPTGVLQKSTFVSLSNSSSGSSPKRDEHVGGGNQLLLSTLASITSL